MGLVTLGLGEFSQFRGRLHLDGERNFAHDVKPRNSARKRSLISPSRAFSAQTEPAPILRIPSPDIRSAR